MRLLVDGFWWFSGPPSGRNVLRDTVQTWIERFPQDTIDLMVPSRDFQRAQVDLAAIGLRNIRSYPRFARNHALAVATLSARDMYDAVISQNFGTFRRVAPTQAVFLHDTLFKRHPEWFTVPERIYLGLVRPSLVRTSIIFTTSDSETAQTAKVWPAAKRILHPVGLGTPTSLTKVSPLEPSLDGVSTESRFILAVGRLNVRKNLEKLIDAYDRSSLRVKGITLVIVGAADGRVSEIIDTPGVVMAGSLGDAELRWLYENCHAFIMPSLDEGFGLPLIEAASLGAPVLASDIPVFRELDVADDYFVPTSPQAILDALERSPSLQRNSPRHTYTWTEVVERMRSALQQPASGGTPSCFRSYVDAKYVGSRGISAGIDLAISDGDLGRFVTTKAVAKVRATLRRYPHAYMGARVSLRSRRSLQMDPGVSIGDHVLIDAMSHNGVRLGAGSTVDRGAIIRGSGGVRRLGVGVEVGRRAAIGANNFIHGGGGVSIGEDSLLGPNVQIFSENHVYTDAHQPIIEQGEVPQPVHIGPDSWIGAGSTILAGVTIGRGSVVAAGSVVTRNIPPYSVVAGVPAKVISTRDGELESDV